MSITGYYNDGFIAERYGLCERLSGQRRHAWAECEAGIGAAH